MCSACQKVLKYFNRAKVVKDVLNPLNPSKSLRVIKICFSHIIDALLAIKWRRKLFKINVWKFVDKNKIAFFDYIFVASVSFVFPSSSSSFSSSASVITCRWHGVDLTGLS